MNYFSYGSNMSVRRLLDRIPSAIRTGRGMLRRHKLVFHKIGMHDGSGKCDIFKTGIYEDIVCGVLYQIEPQDKETLDIKEGLNNGYKQKEVKITLANNSIITCFTYYATNIDDTLRPFDWYLHHVLTGARENHLPKEYINYLETVQPVVDKNIKRKKMELSIYH